jgi:hypothetical protein|tara:strand:- start:722 stop:1870 length:1149 start_codon:yes stop_codon:yes gene_type:complete
MPRLSLYKPEKSADYRFIDRNVNESFQVGGTDIFIHKYEGPVDPGADKSTPSQPYGTNDIPETKIQDLLFLENRDRKYSDDVYVIRGIYNVQDLDFDLSQFGMFLQNDTIFITFHMNSSVENLGRKLMSGDVFELPHLKDEYALNDYAVSLKRFYVVEDVSRPSEGFSQTWYPHLLRAKCKPLLDSQEFKEIFDKDSGEGTGSTIRDVLSTYDKEMQINEAVLNQANEDITGDPAQPVISGYDTKQYFVVPTDDKGNVNINDDGSSTPTLKTAKGNFYVGYLTEQGVPPNGALYSFGSQFPQAASDGEFFLRTDYFPNRLFRYNGNRWVKYEDAVRVETPSSDTAKNQIGTFVNNTSKNTINNKEVDERQALSQVLKPKADN